MSFDLQILLRALPQLLAAAGTTVWIWLACVVLGALLGFAVALLRHYGPAPLARALSLPVDLIRGTPFLVQLFLLYYGGPFIGLALEPVPAGVLSLSVYGSAYFSELFRAGLQAVPRGHVEAAECLGLQRADIVRRILLPEMAVLVLPPAANLAIVLLKETAVLSVVTVPELTLQAGAIGSQYYAFAEALLLLAVFYWGLTTLFGSLGRHLEARLSRYQTRTA